MLGREVVERQQLLPVFGDLRDGLGEPGAVGLGERLDRLLGVCAVLGVVDLLRARSPRTTGVQVEEWRHLADLGRLAAPRRQDLRGEPHPLTCGRVHPPVVHARGRDLDGPAAVVTAWDRW